MQDAGGDPQSTERPSGADRMWAAGTRHVHRQTAGLAPFRGGKEEVQLEPGPDDFTRGCRDRGADLEFAVNADRTLLDAKMSSLNHEAGHAF